MRAALVASGLAALVLAGCRASPPAPAVPAPTGKSAALAKMEHVATAAHRCWFASRDPAFRDYSFANELNSFTGRPRFLLVPRGNYGGRPLLVVQAEGTPARVEIFGPMMHQAGAARIAADVARWDGGSSACA